MRTVLGDRDATNYLWPDASIDEHVSNALGELSRYLPDQSSGLKATDGSGRIDLSTLAGLIEVTGVFATNAVFGFVAEQVGFTVWANELTVEVTPVPMLDTSFSLRWTRAHTVTATASTLPAYLEDLVITGAVGYAAAEGQARSANSVNVGGFRTPGEYRELSLDALTRFRAELARLIGGTVDAEGTVTPAPAAMDVVDEVRAEMLRVENGLSSYTAAMGRLGVTDAAVEFTKYLEEKARLAPAEAAAAAGPLDAVRAEQIKLDAGVTSYTAAMERLGVVDPAAEFAKLLAERRQLAPADEAPAASRAFGQSFMQTANFVGGLDVGLSEKDVLRIIREHAAASEGEEGG